MKFFTLSLRAFLFLLMLGPAAAWAQPTWQWAVAPVSGGTSGSCTVTEVAYGQNGEVVVAGGFRGTLTLGNITLTSAANGADGFVARMTSGGTWTQATSASGLNITGLALSSSGEAVIAGTFRPATVQIGSRVLTNANAAGTSTDVFVARLTPTGTWTQAASAGGLGNESVVDLALQSNGTAVLAGSFGGSTATFGTRVLTNSNSTNSDIYVARLDALGTWIQAAQGGGDGNDGVEGLALDGNNNAVITGYLSGSNTGIANFGPITARLSNGYIFIARLNAVGTWTRVMQSTLDGSFYYPVIDAAGTVTVCGSFTNTANFGAIQLTSAVSFVYDMFIARLSSNDVWVQAVKSGSSTRVTPNSIAQDAAGNVVATGSFSGSQTTFGTHTISNFSSSSAGTFVARLSSTGAWTNALSAGGTGNPVVFKAALESSGNSAAFVGFFDSPTVTFGTVVLNSSSASRTGFVAKLGGLPTATRAPSPAEVFTLAPNPATSEVRLTWPQGTTSARPLQLLDPLGREVRRQLLPAQATTATLDLSGLAPGLYTLRCGAAVSKLVVE